jgi:hypothetical protein
MDRYLLIIKKEKRKEEYQKNFLTSFEKVVLEDFDECLICFSNKSNVCRNRITGF